MRKGNYMEEYKKSLEAFGEKIPFYKLEETKSDPSLVSNILIIVSVSIHSKANWENISGILISLVYDCDDFHLRPYIIPEKYNDNGFTLYLYSNLNLPDRDEDKSNFLQRFTRTSFNLAIDEGLQIYCSVHVGGCFSRISDFYVNNIDKTHPIDRTHPIAKTPPTIIDDNYIWKEQFLNDYYTIKNLADRFDEYKGSLEGFLPLACQSPLGIWSSSKMHYVLADVSAVINDSLVSSDDIQSLISFMAKHIPVFLVPEEEMKRLEMSIPPETRDLQPGEILGYYQHNAYVKTIDIRKKSVLSNHPQIAICPERIEKCAASVGMNYDTLYIQTLVHELSHALMDQYNHIQSDLSFATDMDNGVLYTCSSPNEVEKTAMEESLANCLTLKWFGEFYGKDSKEFKMAIDFMANNQPPVYEFGIYQYKINAGWTLWYRYKNHDVHDALKDWYKKCFDCGKITDWAKKSYSKEDFIAALK